MKLVYTPEDGTRQEWTYKPGKVRATEAEMVEKRTGLTWPDFNRQVAQGSMVCLRALLWLMQRREHPTLRFEDVDFAAGELDLTFDREEWAQMRDAAASMKLPPGVTEDERDQALAQLDAQLDGAPDEGKASASNGA